MRFKFFLTIILIIGINTTLNAQERSNRSLFDQSGSAELALVKLKESPYSNMLVARAKSELSDFKKILKAAHKTQFKEYEDDPKPLLLHASNWRKQTPIYTFRMENLILIHQAMLKQYSKQAAQNSTTDIYDKTSLVLGTLEHLAQIKNKLIKINELLLQIPQPQESSSPENA